MMTEVQTRETMELTDKLESSMEDTCQKTSIKFNNYETPKSIK